VRQFTDLDGESRIKRLAESLGISIDLQFSLMAAKPCHRDADHGVRGRNIHKTRCVKRSQSWPNLFTRSIRPWLQPHKGGTMFSKYKRQTPAAKLASVAADNGAKSDVGAAPGATGVHDDEICARQGGRRPARQEKAQERLKRHPAGNAQGIAGQA
jgi:hypothetical protein